MRWTGWLAAILLVFVLGSVFVVAGSEASGASAPQSASIVLDLKFRPVVRFANGHCGPAVLTSGRYALISISSPSRYGCAIGFVLVDDRTGKRTVIHRSGFTELLAFGAPWIFFFEDNRFALYNIATKKTRSCGVPGCVPSGEAIRYALGSRWLETFVQQPGPCGDGVHNDGGPVTQSFYNIRTGRIRRGLAANSTRVADLNSPRLFQRVCAPLQIPPGGTLTFYSSFAIATAADRSSRLERCGSNLQMPIGMSQQGGPVGLLFANTHAALWQILDPYGVWNGQLAGILLPSLRRFTATAPSNLNFPFALDAFRLYAGDANGRLWAASIPR